MSSAALLQIEGLRVDFETRQGCVQALRGIDLTIAPGESLALVGESGSGKSVTAQAIMGLVDLPGVIRAGRICWQGRPVLGQGVDARALPPGLWGGQIGMVFQNPMTSLNPLMTIGAQLTEGLRRHLRLPQAAARDRAAELLSMVGIAGAQRRLAQYPHEFSGGMRQRVMIAMAIACEPRLLIADEPTTALDVTVQAQIVELLAGLQQRLGLAILMITHDLGLVAGLCDRVAVMYAGRIIEEAAARDLFAQPLHPYAQGLIRAAPRLEGGQDRLIAIEGTPPALMPPPPGCAFAPRCPLAADPCRQGQGPDLRPWPDPAAPPPPSRPYPARAVACWQAGAQAFAPLAPKDRP